MTKKKTGNRKAVQKHLLPLKHFWSGVFKLDGCIREQQQWLCVCSGAESHNFTYCLICLAGVKLCNLKHVLQIADGEYDLTVA